MIWLYRILFLPIFLVLLPHYLLRMWRRGGYQENFWQRLGGKSDLPPKNPQVRRIWLQAVSVGEIRAMEPLLDYLLSQPSVEVVLSTTTTTGYALAQSTLLPKFNRLWVRYFPLDFWIFSHRVWNHVQPDIALLAEGEIWPEHLHQAQHRNCPVFLLNGRLSDRSFRRFRYAQGWIRRLLHKFEHILAASEQDAERFLLLGAAPARVTVTGNLKLEIPLSTPFTAQEKKSWCQQLGFPTLPLPYVLVGASTWPGEEAFLHHLVCKLRERGEHWVLLLVPRHAERGPSLRREFSGVPDIRFWNDPLSETPIHTVVADVTGKMREFLQGADLVFAGKSLPPHEGGQTPLEAAAASAPVVTGPHMENFRSLVREMVQQGVLLQGSSPEETTQYLESLMLDHDRRRAMGSLAHAWMSKQKGTLLRIQRILQPYISDEIRCHGTNSE
jgi:3-deoxy-D-manno-octulosonic-acid transferase